MLLNETLIHGTRMANQYHSVPAQTQPPEKGKEQVECPELTKIYNSFSTYNIISALIAVRIYRAKRAGYENRSDGESSDKEPQAWWAE